ncbi:DsbA family protein [Vibrio hannami]|uniref:DsbA family protein n=1 Tax=Vibrio hannami TaxID=2717094 RepID=UPI0024102C3F|nr:DsbA family protein [Vibrio hannami]MDG3084937.1 DsbA family protein [Vibrio hannami]
MVKVHYFFDPMCGWCYGATSLLVAIAANTEIELALHPGGMIDNKAIEPDFRSHILVNDERIAKMTGAQFGDEYIQRVKSDDKMILDSFITARAILTAKQLGIAPLDMLKAIQHAHYVDGKQVNHPKVLEELSVKLGLEGAQWHKTMNANLGIEQEEIQRSRLLMQKLQVYGYPTLILEVANKFIVLPHTEFYGKPDEWQQLVDSYIRSDSSTFQTDM